MTNNSLVWDRIPAPKFPNLAFLGVSELSGLKWVKATDSKVGIAIDLPPGLDFNPGKPFRNLEFDVIKPSSVGDKSFFCVLFSEPGSFDIFEDLCRSLIKGLDGIQDPVARAKTTISRANAWSDLFKSGRRELTKEQILGLICELHFLTNRWLPLDLGVDTWFVPDRTSQDFVDSASNVAIEIKHMDASHSVSVSSIYQLQFDGELFLVAYQLKDDPNGQSLNGLVEQVLDQLDPLAKADFESKLIRVGYEMRSSYDDCYSVVSESVYKIANEFPRIIPGTLHGLVKASYTLQLDSSFDQFLVTVDEMGEAIEC